jgi:hypothetical protein
MILEAVDRFFSREEVAAEASLPEEAAEPVLIGLPT